jgi:predicted transcriptional regulator
VLKEKELRQFGEYRNKVVHLSPDRAERLTQLAEQRGLPEDTLIEKALDLMFSLSEEADAEEARRTWQTMGMKALERVWDNDADAVYDNWRELYGVPETGLLQSR